MGLGTEDALLSGSGLRELAFTGLLFGDQAFKADRVLGLACRIFLESLVTHNNWLLSAKVIGH